MLWEHYRHCPQVTFCYCVRKDRDPVAKNPLAFIFHCPSMDTLNFLWNILGSVFRYCSYTLKILHRNNRNLRLERNSRSYFLSLADLKQKKGYLDLLWEGVCSCIKNWFKKQNLNLIRNSDILTFDLILKIWYVDTFSGKKTSVTTKIS